MGKSTLTPPNPNNFLAIFTPDIWSPARTLYFFLGPPFTATHRLREAISAVENRRQKAETLAGLANDLRIGIPRDRQEFERDGATPATRAQRYTAIIEAIILELYSRLDANRTVLFEIYKGVRGVQKNSTERLLKRAVEGAYGEDFPEPLCLALATAYRSWFPELRRIRSELSHGGIGSCHVNSSSGSVTYMHPGLGSAQRALVIEDVEAKVSYFLQSVTEFTDTIFSFLCSQLEPTDRRLPCGVFEGRFYERTVRYSSTLSQHSGSCYSRQWFEAEPARLCPLRTRCGAYSRATSTASGC